MLDRDFIQKVMQKPMSRKDFLRHFAVALLGLVGINSIIALLLQSHPQTKKLTEAQSRRGFGGGKYGV